MAKALLGFATSAVDPRLLSELRSLRLRVRDLEGELDRSRSENAVLSAALEVVDGSVRETLAASGQLSLPEPAYT